MNEWLYFKSAISADIIQDITRKGVEAGVAAGGTFNGSGSDVRSSRVSWLSNDRHTLDMLFDFVNEANKQWGINIFKKSDIQYTEYHAQEGGHYDWHHDVNWSEPQHRKLSVTVQLSSPLDYEGGDFEFKEIESPDIAAKEQGTVLVFPSYYLHKVSPVTSGVRKSLVAWFEGPRWL